MRYNGEYKSNKGYAIFVDPETGVPGYISRKAYDAIMEARKRMNDFIRSKSNGVMAIHSTIADDSGDDIKNLWNDWKH